MRENRSRFFLKLWVFNPLVPVQKSLLKIKQILKLKFKIHPFSRSIYSWNEFFEKIKRILNLSLKVVKIWKCLGYSSSVSWNLSAKSINRISVDLPTSSLLRAFSSKLFIDKKIFAFPFIALNESENFLWPYRKVPSAVELQYS